MVMPERSSIFGLEGDTVQHKLWEAMNAATMKCAAIMSSFVLLCLMFTYRKEHHLNLLLFEAFAVVQGYFVGLLCAVVDKRIVAHAAALTFVIFGVLTALSFQLSAVGADLGFLGPFLAEALALVVWSSVSSLVFGYEWFVTVSASMGALLFSIYIVYDTNQIVKRYADDEYIAAAANLYLDVLNLFLKLVQWLAEIDGGKT